MRTTGRSSCRSSVGAEPEGTLIVMDTHDVIYAGARAPEAAKIRVHRGDSQIDLRTATAAFITVRGPGGYETSWACEIAPGPTPPAPTMTHLTVIHPFGAGEVDVPGEYVLVATLTVPGGQVRADPVRMKVKPQFDASCTGHD